MLGLACAVEDGAESAHKGISVFSFQVRLGGVCRFMAQGCFWDGTAPQFCLKSANSHMEGHPEPVILVSVVTFEAVQLRGVSKVAVFAAPSC